MKPFIPPQYTNEIIAYTAGLVERAAISLQKRKTSKVKGVAFTASIVLRSRNEFLADWLCAYWGALKFKEADKPPYGSGWVCLINGMKALHLIKNVFPYLIATKNHALVIEAFRKIREKFEKKISYTPEIIKKCDILYETILSINRTGNTCYEARRKFRIQQNKNRVKEIYHNNIFDLFDSTLTESESRMAKSIFDDLLP